MGKPKADLVKKSKICDNCGEGQQTVCGEVAIPKITWYATIGKYLMNLILWLDLGLNTFTFGSPYESVSSRLGRHYKGTWVEVMVDKFAWHIFKQKFHCENATRPTRKQREDAIFK